MQVVRIADVTKPKEVTFIQAKNSYPGERIPALHIDTSALNGRPLVATTEMQQTNGFVEINLNHSRDPTLPDHFTISVHRKREAHEIHGVLPREAGDKGLPLSWMKRRASLLKSSTSPTPCRNGDAEETRKLAVRQPVSGKLNGAALGAGLADAVPRNCLHQG